MIIITIIIVVMVKGIWSVPIHNLFQNYESFINFLNPTG